MSVHEPLRALIERWRSGAMFTEQDCADQLEAALAALHSPQLQEKKDDSLLGTTASEGEQHPPSTSREPEAYAYLSRLLVSFAPTCVPLPDLLGLCSQIDNLLCGRLPVRKCVHCGGPNPITCNRCYGMVAYRPFGRDVATGSADPIRLQNQANEKSLPSALASRSPEPEQTTTAPKPSPGRDVPWCDWNCALPINHAGRCSPRREAASQAEPEQTDPEKA